MKDIKIHNLYNILLSYVSTKQRQANILKMFLNLKILLNLNKLPIDTASNKLPADLRKQQQKDPDSVR